jgi:hypothetical protein
VITELFELYIDFRTLGSLELKSENSDISSRSCQASDRGHGFCVSINGVCIIDILLYHCKKKNSGVIKKYCFIFYMEMKEIKQQCLFLIFV